MYHPNNLRILGPSTLVMMIDAATSIEQRDVVLADYHVLCSVTGQKIKITDLKYWNVERQIAYISPEVVVKEHFYPDVD